MCPARITTLISDSEHRPPGTLILSFREGLVSAFMLPLTNQARALSSGWSPPVSISAGRQVTRKFLPRTGAWAGRRLAFSPRSALRVSRNLFASRLISSLHEHGPGDTSPPSFCASAVPSAHPQGAVVLTARPDSEGHSVGNAARICSDHRTCSRHLRGL